MNKPISFPLSKLLKEKGFDLPTHKYYEYALKSVKNREDGYSGNFGWKKGELNLQTQYFINNSKISDLTSEMWYMCLAPTIAKVVMWLYEEYEAWINVGFSGDETCYLMVTNKIGNIKWNGKGFNSPTEAYEAAIAYTLKYLI